MSSLSTRWAPPLAVFALLASAGCDKISGIIEDPGKAVQEQMQAVQETASKAVESVKETVSGSGSAELTLDKPLNATACFATLVQPGDGRGAVLELKNHSHATAESFPSYLFHATAPSASWPELAGQQLSGQLFVRFDANGPIWFTPRDQPVEVRISTSDGQSLEAEIVGGSLTSTDGAPLPALAGKFHAVVRAAK